MSLPLGATSGIMQLGYGVKSNAMGGVGIALPMDAFAPASNPAGLMELCDRFDLGVEWLRQEGQFRFNAEVEDPPLAFFNKQRSIAHQAWPQAAIARHFGCRLALGLAFYSFGGWKTHYDDANPFFGSSPLGSTFQAYFLTPSLAFQLNCVHSLGIAINLAHAHFRAKGLERLMGESIDPTSVTNRGLDHTVGISARIGWRAKLLRCLAIGLTYQTPTWLDRFDKYQGFLPRGRLNLPAQLGAGVMWRFHPLVLFSADVVKIFWRDGHGFENTSADTEPYGSNRGPGFGWRDQVALKFGFAWDVLPRMTFRWGYHHVDAPPFRSSTFLNILTAETIKDTITFGSTWRVGCHELNVYYYHGIAHHILGDSNLLLGQLCTPVRLMGRQDAFGISWGYKY